MKAFFFFAFLLIAIGFFALFLTGCGCDDDDDDSSNSGDDDDDNDTNTNDDDDDDDDDTAYDYPFRAPVDVNEDGELDVVFEVRDGWVDPPIGRLEVHSAQTADLIFATEELDGASFYSILNDFDNDGYGEIYLENGRTAPDTQIHYHLFDGPGLDEIFTANYTGQSYYGLSTPDFDNDGVADFPIDYQNADTNTARKAVYDVTNSFSTLWDTGEQANIRLEIFGVRNDFNFESRQTSAPPDMDGY